MSSAKTSMTLEKEWLLISAIKRDDFKLAKLLLDERNVNINCVDAKGRSCLYWAIERPDTKMLKFLLERNVDINPEKRHLHYWGLPLLYAIISGRHKAAELLIRAGAEVNVWHNGLTPLQLTVISSNIFLTRLLLDSGARVFGSILVTAYRHQSSLDVIKALLDRVPIRSFVSQQQISQLIQGLCEHRNEEAIQLLNDHPQINVLWDPADLNGKTALHFAAGMPCGKDHAAIVRLLLARGVEIDAMEKCSGMTALHMALLRGKVNMARELINSGANVNAKTTDKGIFPLFLAVDGKNFRRADMTKLLISKGANLNARTASSDEHQRTALHNACRHHTDDSICALLVNGADPLIKDKTGHTAFQLLTSLGVEAARQMVKSLAAIAVADKSKIDDNDLELISQKPQLLEYYKQCTTELERMRETKVYDHLTLFRVQFGMSKDRLAKLLKNEDFKFSLRFKIFEKRFPVYEDFIRAKLERAEKEMKTRSVIKEHLQNAFASLLPDIILECMVNYLKISDLGAFDTNSC